MHYLSSGYSSRFRSIRVAFLNNLIFIYEVLIRENRREGKYNLTDRL